ncbi:MAG: hypothetical protein HC811_01565 [Flammeovirgaceae bacterium]|nr:hypothetical protein [Flammeovirgaceae bacterium]
MKTKLIILIAAVITLFSFTLASQAVNEKPEVTEPVANERVDSHEGIMMEDRNQFN